MKHLFIIGLLSLLLIGSSYYPITVIENERTITYLYNKAKAENEQSIVKCIQPLLEEHVQLIKTSQDLDERVQAIIRSNELLLETKRCWYSIEYVYDISIPDFVNLNERNLFVSRIS